MAEKIVFNVRPDGGVDVDATEGYQGNDCMRETAAVVEALKEMGIEITAENIKMIAVTQEVSNDQMAKS